MALTIWLGVLYRDNNDAHTNNDENTAQLH